MYFTDTSKDTRNNQQFNLPVTYGRESAVVSRYISSFHFNVIVLSRLPVIMRLFYHPSLRIINKD